MLLLRRGTLEGRLLPDAEWRARLEAAAEPVDESVEFGARGVGFSGQLCLNGGSPEGATGQFSPLLVRFFQQRPARVNSDGRADRGHSQAWSVTLD